MFGVLIFAIVLAGVLALLLARYGTNPAAARAARRHSDDDRPRMPSAYLRSLTLELLDRLGLNVVEEELRGDARRLVALRPGPFQGTRYLVFLEPQPPGDVIEQPMVIELADAVRGDWGSVGLLVTPYRISRDGLGGLDVKLELIDGERLRALVANYLPERLAEVDRYRGFGAAQTVVSPTIVPQPTT